MPGNLFEALLELDKSELIKCSLGSHIYEKFREGKMAEWVEYNMQVTPWEVKQYLTRF